MRSVQSAGTSRLSTVAGGSAASTRASEGSFNRRQSASVRALIAGRMRDLPSSDFAEMLRSAMREDEWLLLLHGAVLGFGAGLLHLLIFG